MKRIVVLGAGESGAGAAVLAKKQGFDVFVSDTSKVKDQYKKLLDDHGIEYTARHIKENNPTADELREWVARSGLPLKRFFNTSGLVYKNLSLKDKLPTMTEDEQIALLASDGMLVKRPLLVGDDFVLPGFKPAEWGNALL